MTVPELAVQPEGSVPTVTPEGGVYVNVVGPAASDGPPFVAESVTVPDVPGVIVGVVTVSERSARAVSTTTVVGVTVLLPVAGSVVVVEADAEPPDIGPEAAEAGTETGIAIELAAPAATSPVTVQVTVPLVSVQPDGSVPTVTPEGGV